MLLGLHQPGRAFTYTLIILGSGFIWGGIAVNVPIIREAQNLPYIAHNWAIALPIFVLWIVLSYVLAKDYLYRVNGGATEGLRLGAMFAISAILYDLIVIAWIIGVGWMHFEQLILWVTYGLLLFIPWFVGRSMVKY